MSDKPLPIEKWSLWKVILMPFGFFGIWAAFPIFYPYYSPAALIIGVFLVVVGVVGAVLISRRRRRLGQIAFSNAFLLIMFTTAARAWLVVIGKVWLWALWMILLLPLYFLAWVLPTLNSKLSAFLWKEQYTPETRPGKVILNISARILPIAGSGGALIGMYGSRSGYDDFGALFLGFAFSLVSIGLAQVTSHSFWREDRRRERKEMEVE